MAMPAPAILRNPLKYLFNSESGEVDRIPVVNNPDSESGRYGIVLLPTADMGLSTPAEL
jgi:hypothetical protein